MTTESSSPTLRDQPPLLTSHHLVAEWTPDDGLLSTQALLARHVAMHSGGARAKRLLAALRERVEAAGLSSVTRPLLAPTTNPASGIAALPRNARQYLQNHSNAWSILPRPGSPEVLAVVTEQGVLLYSLIPSQGAFTNKEDSAPPISSCSLQLEASWKEEEEEEEEEEGGEITQHAVTGWRKGVWSADGSILAVSSSHGTVHILQASDLTLLLTLPSRIPRSRARSASGSFLNASAETTSGLLGGDRNKNMGNPVLDPIASLLFLPLPRTKEALGHSHLLGIFGYGDSMHAYFIHVPFMSMGPEDPSEAGDGPKTILSQVQAVRKRKRASSTTTRTPKAQGPQVSTAPDISSTLHSPEEVKPTLGPSFTPAFRHRFSQFRSVTSAVYLETPSGSGQILVTGLAHAPFPNFRPDTHSSTSPPTSPPPSPSPALARAFTSTHLADSAFSTSVSAHQVSFWELLPESPYLKELPGPSQILSGPGTLPFGGGMSHPVHTSTSSSLSLGTMLASLRSRTLMSSVSSDASGVITEMALSPDGKQVILLDGGGGVSLWDVTERKRVRTWSSALLSYVARDAAYTDLSYDDWRELLQGSGPSRSSLEVKANHAVWWREQGYGATSPSEPLYLLLITYEDGRYILTRTDVLGNLRSHDMDKEGEILGEESQEDASTTEPILVQDTPLLSTPIALPPERLQNVYSLIRSDWGKEGNREAMWVLEVEERPLRVRVAGDKVTVGWRYESKGDLSKEGPERPFGQGEEEEIKKGTPTEPRTIGTSNEGMDDMPEAKTQLQIYWQWLQGWLLGLLQWLTSLVLWHWDVSQGTGAARGTYWTIGRRRVRLASLERQDSMAAVEARLASADWAGALRTAERWGVPTDVVWKARWLDAPVTKEAVDTLLSQVRHDIPWVLDTCVLRVANDPESQRALLEHGLRCMEEEWAVVEGKGEGEAAETWKETLAKYRLILLRYLARLDSYMIITRAMRRPDAGLLMGALNTWSEDEGEEEEGNVGDETMGWEDSFMALEEKAQSIREKEEGISATGQGKAEADTEMMETGLPGDVELLESELDSFPADFTHFRDVNILAQAMEYAYQGFFPALRVLLTRHRTELTGFIHLILDQVPITTSPSFYLPLLPGSEGEARGDMETDQLGHGSIQEDWIFKQGWAKRVGWIEDGEDLHFSPFPIHRQVPEEEDDVDEGMSVMDRRLSWIYARAREVEAGSGDLGMALQVLSPTWCKDPYGKAGQWKNRVRSLRRLLHWLSHWVYECGKEDWTLRDLEDPEEGGVKRWSSGLMTGLSGDSWVDRWTNSLAPFLTQVLESGTPKKDVGLLGLSGWEDNEVREAVSGCILRTMGQGDVVAVKGLLSMVRSGLVDDAVNGEEGEEGKVMEGEVKKKSVSLSLRRWKKEGKLGWVKVLLQEREWKALLLACAYSEGCTGPVHTRGKGIWKAPLAQLTWWGNGGTNQEQGLKRRYHWLRQVFQERSKGRIGASAHTLPADLYQTLFPTQTVYPPELRPASPTTQVDLDPLGETLREEHLSIGALLQGPTLLDIGLAAAGERVSQGKVLDGLIRQAPSDADTLRGELTMLKEHGYLPPVSPSVTHTLVMSLLHRERYELVNQWLSLAEESEEKRDIVLAILDASKEALDSVEGRGDEGDAECIRCAESCLSILPTSLDASLSKELMKRVQTERYLQEGLRRLRQWGVWRSPVTLRKGAGASEEVMRIMRALLSSQPQRILTIDAAQEVEQIWQDLMHGSAIDQNHATSYWRWRLAMMRTCRSEGRVTQALSLLHATAQYPWGGSDILEEVETELRALWQDWESKTSSDYNGDEDEMEGGRSAEVAMWEGVFGSLMAMEEVNATEMEAFMRIYEDWEKSQMRVELKGWALDDTSDAKDASTHVYALYDHGPRSNEWLGHFWSERTRDGMEEMEEFKRALQRHDSRMSQEDHDRLIRAFSSLKTDLIVALTYLQGLGELKLAELVLGHLSPTSHRDAVTLFFYNLYLSLPYKGSDKEMDSQLKPTTDNVYFARQRVQALQEGGKERQITQYVEQTLEVLSGEHGGSEEVERLKTNETYRQECAEAWIRRLIEDDKMEIEGREGKRSGEKESKSREAILGMKNHFKMDQVGILHARLSSLLSPLQPSLNKKELAHEKEEWMKPLIGHDEAERIWEGWKQGPGTEGMALFGELLQAGGLGRGSLGRRGRGMDLAAGCLEIAMIQGDSTKVSERKPDLQSLQARMLVVRRVLDLMEEDGLWEEGEALSWGWEEVEKVNTLLRNAKTSSDSEALDSLKELILPYLTENTVLVWTDILKAADQVTPSPWYGERVGYEKEEGVSKAIEAQQLPIEWFIQDRWAQACEYGQSLGCGYGLHASAISPGVDEEVPAEVSGRLDMTFPYLDMLNSKSLLSLAWEYGLVHGQSLPLMSRRLLVEKVQEVSEEGDTTALFERIYGHFNRMEALQSDGPPLKEDLGHGRWYKRLDEALAKGSLGENTAKMVYSEVKDVLIGWTKEFPGDLQRIGGLIQILRDDPFEEDHHEENAVNIMEILSASLGLVLQEFHVGAESDVTGWIEEVLNALSEADQKNAPLTGAHQTFGKHLRQRVLQNGRRDTETLEKGRGESGVDESAPWSPQLRLSLLKILEQAGVSAKDVPEAKDTEAEAEDEKTDQGHKAQAYSGASEDFHQVWAHSLIESIWEASLADRLSGKEKVKEPLWEDLLEHTRLQWKQKPKKWGREALGALAHLLSLWSPLWREPLEDEKKSRRETLWVSLICLAEEMRQSGWAMLLRGYLEKRGWSNGVEQEVINQLGVSTAAGSRYALLSQNIDVLKEGVTALTTPDFGTQNDRYLHLLIATREGCLEQIQRNDQLPVILRSLLASPNHPSYLSPTRLEEHERQMERLIVRSVVALHTSNAPSAALVLGATFLGLPREQALISWSSLEMRRAIVTRCMELVEQLGPMGTTLEEEPLPWEVEAEEERLWVEEWILTRMDTF
ncbi:hypothetical protein BJ684DRAFT_14995 [Piptocephalis cylindrospora]|uniref:Uncharacterized protein n=1 Tax=Piptocephalis cylindrospora TaxID=1907219 RepID=A0A4P9Y6H7_9FUNG|nr:hypothetical protein BJ684DRAFT_14995 [Piptocephalis cylindrospora]|eukprot:RKP14688.1 hypothetical protein BJ684DRAFT_14995 [Piptocephalis cylindrospora]